MLTVVGLSHHGTGTSLREQVALPDEALPQLLPRAAAISPVGEALIVSTCNRVEFYLGGGAGSLAGGTPRRAVAELLGATSRCDVPEVEAQLYVYEGEAALRHLFRVAASLDSMVVGEPQILGQVKEAFKVAAAAGTAQGLLGRALPRAFAAAKRVRSETEIGRSSASVSSAAVELARHIFGDLRGKQVLLVGAGKMGALAARHLASAGAGPLLVVNRTLSRAEALASQIVAEAHPFTALEALLARADVVVCATGAREPVLRRELVQRAMKARRGRWLCIVDIAMPRDVEPEVGGIENVYLYDLDALQELVGGHLAGRQREAAAAERIIDEELAGFLVAERSLGVVPTIRALRDHFVRVARAEAGKSLGRLPSLGERERREVDALADAIVAKLLHAPLSALKRDADTDSLVTAARRLFALDGEPAPSQEAPGSDAATKERGAR